MIKKSQSDANLISKPVRSTKVTDSNFRIEKAQQKLEELNPVNDNNNFKHLK